MSSDDTKAIYPSTQIEEPTENLLTKPTPPTYDQATADDPRQYAQPIPASTAASGDPHVVILTQNTALPFGPNPVDIQCPYCHNYCRTRMRAQPTSRTHLMALLLCVFQLYCCVCIPYCIDSCMNANHYCGMCDKYLGTYVR